MTASLRKRAASLLASGRDGAERPGSRTGQTLAKQFLVPRHDDRCCERFVETITKLRSEGKIGNTVAMLSVADQFGIGLAKAARRAPKKSGFDLVYDRSSTVEPQDMRAIMTEVTHLNPDSFVAFSYPPDTIAITEQARALSFNPKVFYTAVATAFPLYKQRFGADVEGVMGLGGWNADAPESQNYLKRHVEMTGQEPDRWASPVTYASLQMLQQAIERVGAIDRAAAIRELQTGTFETILGPVKLENNLYTENWWVGQWQNGEFHGITPATLPGARDNVPKAGVACRLTGYSRRWG